MTSTLRTYRRLSYKKVQFGDEELVPIDSVLLSAFNLVVSGDEWGNNFSIKIDFDGGCGWNNKFDCDCEWECKCDRKGLISLTSVDGAVERKAVDDVDDGSISTDGRLDRGNINWPITSCPDGVRICTNSPNKYESFQFCYDYCFYYILYHDIHQSHHCYC